MTDKEKVTEMINLLAEWLKDRERQEVILSKESYTGDDNYGKSKIYRFGNTVHSHSLNNEKTFSVYVSINIREEG